MTALQRLRGHCVAWTWNHNQPYRLLGQKAALTEVMAFAPTVSTKLTGLQSRMTVWTAWPSAGWLLTNPSWHHDNSPVPLRAFKGPQACCLSAEVHTDPQSTRIASGHRPLRGLSPDWETAVLASALLRVPFNTVYLRHFGRLGREGSDLGCLG